MIRGLASQPAGLSAVTGRRSRWSPSRLADVGAEGVQVDDHSYDGGGAAMTGSPVAKVLQERHERLAPAPGHRQFVDLAERGAAGDV